ncbi:MAG: type II 3-dehydroquinate dehydratase [Acetobacteraceae bacterium]
MADPLVAVLNGPNLNLLGSREPGLYGSATLADVETLCRDRAARHGLTLEFRQSNHEGELIGWVQGCRGRAGGIVINPGGYTHTSVALLDALLASDLPVIEVHLTNLHRREPFRQTSITGKAATGVIAGLGAAGYALAIEAMAGLIARCPAPTETA